MDFRRIKPANLGRGAIATTPTLTTLRITPALTRDIVKCIDICNTTAGVLTITVYLVESGGAAGASNTLIPTINMPPNGVFQWTGTQVLNAGDSIQATASGAGITINVSGAEAV